MRILNFANSRKELGLSKEYPPQQFGARATSSPHSQHSLWRYRGVNRYRAKSYGRLLVAKIDPNHSFSSVKDAF